MLETVITEPFFFFGPAQTSISRQLLLIASQGNMSVNATGKTVTWKPFDLATYAIDFIGTGLSFAGTRLAGGHVDEIRVYRTLDGSPILATKGFALDAIVLQAAIDDTLRKQADQGQTDAWAADDLRARIYDGNDQTVVGSASGDEIISGKGNDLVKAGDGDDIVVGSAGNDTYKGGSGSNLLRLGSAADAGFAILDLINKIVVYENGDRQTIQGFHWAEGTSFGDTITGDHRANVLSGREGNDRILGLGGNDWLRGDGGNDTIEGGGGNDAIFGGDGRDTILGEDGDDELFGDAHDDTIRGGPDNDLISGGTGQDELFGNAGKDRMNGGTGNDFMNGGGHHDRMRGGNGDEIGFLVSGILLPGMLGGAGNDRMFGGKGADIMDGGADNDTMFGGSGSDELWGGSGNDMLNGGPGNDLLSGGPGDDLMSGGTGFDVFDFTDRLSLDSDRITDFEAGDRIVLNGTVVADVIIGGAGPATIFFFGGTIDLDGIDSALLAVTQAGSDVMIELA